jgi:phage repressor protein C with HTH and peptisase S24 domain
MSSPADRLRALAEAAGFESLSDLARAATIQEATMRQHIARDSIPKAAASLYARAGRRTGVSVEWLLYGKGTPPKGVDPDDRPEPIAKQLLFADKASVMVPELEVHAMAGHGADGQFLITQADAVDAMTGQYSFPSAGFRQAFGANAGEVIIAEVLGDSMMPTLYPGQKVMVHIHDKRPTPPGIFYVWDGMGLVIKRVELIPGSNPPTVRIKSDNPKYETYERTVDEAHINGRVILGFTRF